MNNKQITVIVKPTSACNLRCRYCYHAETNYENGILPHEKLEQFIRLLLEEYNSVVFIWHGGEPLLCGPAYFKTAVELQNRYRKEGQRIVNAVQTNGILLDDEFLTFFRENRFAVSISFDGPGGCNALRGETEKTVDAFMKAINAGVKPASLSVIHSLNMDKQIEMYRFFKQYGLNMKFNPVFGPSSKNSKPDYIPDTKRYIASVKELFEYWLYDKTAVHLDTIDQYLSMYFRGRGRDCSYGSCLYNWLGIDGKGNLYPCGRYYGPEFLLGNIMDYTNIRQVFLHKNYTELLKKSILRRNQCQNSCKYFSVCHGGCNNSCILDGDLEKPSDFQCTVLKEMLPYVKKTMDSYLKNTKEDQLNPVIAGYLKTGRKTT